MALLLHENGVSSAGNQEHRRLFALLRDDLAGDADRGQRRAADGAGGESCRDAAARQFAVVLPAADRVAGGLVPGSAGGSVGVAVWGADVVVAGLRSAADLFCGAD